MASKGQASVKNRVQFYDSLRESTTSSVGPERSTRGMQVTSLIDYFEDLIAKGIKLTPSMRKLYQDTVKMKAKLDKHEKEYHKWYANAVQQLVDPNADVFYDAMDRFNYENRFITVQKRPSHK